MHMAVIANSLNFFLFLTLFIRLSITQDRMAEFKYVPTFVLYD